MSRTLKQTRNRPERTPAGIRRWRLVVRGQVQGVGFRPAIFRLAAENRLNGWIKNTPSGLLIEIEGAKNNVAGFLDRLETAAPALAKIDSIEKTRIKPLSGKKFIIKPSSGNEARTALIPPDICTCKDCLSEMFDSSDRRYLYPFINCVNCGPRFTIVRDIPYDRPNTTMKKFNMCPVCRREYENPLDRRFHAQPNACPECGPEVYLLSNDKKKLSSGVGAIKETVRLLASGRIAAIKGIGGFHLACDALNDRAVETLRKRKYREDKPFALMAKDLETIRQFCEISPEEKELLLSPERPIVLLKKRADPEKQASSHAAPGNKFLGFMLPYSPLHYVIFNSPSAPEALVMTSGNISDEPICHENEEAAKRLEGIADFFLLNNRDIHMRCDDSVARVVPLPTAGKNPVAVIRRSRGYVPAPLKLGFKFNRPVLACGAELKNTFCLAKNEFAFISHHIGDLENAETLDSFEKGIEHFKRLFSIKPEIIAHDLHPEYLSTKYALESSLRAVGVQHHHAHIAGCMAENNIAKEKVIGVAFDGLGYGPDGTLWGGEFLVCDLKDYKRAAHLSCIPLPGGSMAIKEPWRTACSHLYYAFGKDFPSLDIEFIRKLGRNSAKNIEQVISGGLNSPLTSSMGRLFDAVSAILNIRHSINYEGEAAIELEQSADPGQIKESPYEFDILKEKGGGILIDPRPLIAGIAKDAGKGAAKGKISAGFHFAVARMMLDVCRLIAKETGLKKVVLGGGVFQNLLLLQNSYKLLDKAGFKVYFNSKTPANDGGISLGQAAVANFTDR